MAPADPRYAPTNDGASAARASHGTHASATAAEAPGTVSQRGRSGGAGGPAGITRSLGRLPTRLESDVLTRAGEKRVAMSGARDRLPEAIPSLEAAPR